MSRMLECPWDETQQQDLELAVASALPWEEMDGKTVFVTGATGLVGSQLVKIILACNRIRKLNIKVLALVRSEEKAKQVFGHLLELPELKLHLGDVTRRMDVEGEVDYIIHAASQTVSKEFVTHPVETIDTSFVGTKNILELAAEKKSRSVVYVSSMEAYGNPGQMDRRATEKDLGYIDNLSVRSCYSEGKRFCECLCACYYSEYEVPVKIARLAQTFGAGVSHSENRVFAQFAKSAMNGTDIVLHTQGKSFGNYCYTADVVTGLLTVMLKGENGQAYNVVCENATMRIAQMAQLVADEIAGGKINVVFDIPESALTYGYAPDVELRLDGQKLRNLGWEPAIAPDLATMYRRMIASFQAQGFRTEK